MHIVCRLMVLRFLNSKKWITVEAVWKLFRTASFWYAYISDTGKRTLSGYVKDLPHSFLKNILADYALQYCTDFSVFKKDEGRDNISLVPGSKGLGFINIGFTEFYAASVLFFYIFYYRFHHSAFSAPGGVEHDDDREAAAGCFSFKVFGCQVQHVNSPFFLLISGSRYLG